MYIYLQVYIYIFILHQGSLQPDLKNYHHVPIYETIPPPSVISQTGSCLIITHKSRMFCKDILKIEDCKGKSFCIWVDMLLNPER